MIHDVVRSIALPLRGSFTVLEMGPDTQALLLSTREVDRATQRVTATQLNAALPRAAATGVRVFVRVGSFWHRVQAST